MVDLRRVDADVPHLLDAPGAHVDPDRVTVHQLHDAAGEGGGRGGGERPQPRQEQGEDGERESAGEAGTAA
jgi:hypothetical protein